MEVVAFVGLARNECAPQFIHSLTQRQRRPGGLQEGPAVASALSGT